MAERRRILLVENDPDFLSIRKQLLEHEGYQVYAATSPAEAKRLLDSTLIHLVISDIRIMDDSDEEDVSGLELVRRLDPVVPKIIVTAYPAYEYVRKALEPLPEGLPVAVDFITKQEGPIAFLKAVEKALDTYVNINLDLDLIWTEGLSPDLLADRLRSVFPKSYTKEMMTEEILDLFCRLFLKADTVIIAPSSMFAETTIALRVIPYYREKRAEPLITKVGERAQIATEQENYERYVRKGPSQPVVMAHAFTQWLGAVAYELIGLPRADTRSVMWYAMQVEWSNAATALLTESTNLFENSVSALVGYLCDSIGSEASRPVIKKGDFWITSLDMSQVFQGTALPSELPLVFAQVLHLTGKHLDAVRHLLQKHTHPPLQVALLFLFGKESDFEAAGYLVQQKLRDTYAYDVILVRPEDLESITIAESPQRILRRLVLSRVDLISVSPFVITGSTPDSMFFGRERELREITEHVTTTSYAVIGGRRIGKTSILGRLHRVRLPAVGSQTFHYHCQHLPSTEPTHQQFLEAIAHEWLPELADFTPSSFSDILAQLRGDKSLVFLIDEADRLIPADRAAGWPLFGELRALAESARCQFVFAGERTLREATKSGKSPLFNFANAMPLGCLEFPAVKELVTRPMRQLEIDLTDEAMIVQHIWYLTSGHPNVVQRLCQRLIRRLNERRDRCLTPDDVEAVIADPAFQRDDFYDVHLEQATVLERILPLVLAQDGNEPYTLSEVCRLLDERLNLVSPNGEKPRAAEVDAALRRLTDLRSILDYTPQGYVFAVKAFPQVIARWGQMTVEDELMILTEKYRDYGDLTEDEIEQKEREP